MLNKGFLEIEKIKKRVVGSRNWKRREDCMEQMQRTRSEWGRRKTGHGRWYSVKRLAAFVLSFAMIFGNIGNSAITAMAGENFDCAVQFQMSAEAIWSAAKEAVRSGNPAGGYLTFGQENEAEAARYEKLFSKGNLFEITEAVNYTAVPDVDGMDLRVFIRTSEGSGLEGFRLTGDEELLFLYMNSGEENVSASVNIDGQVSGKTVVKSYKEAFGQEEVPEAPEMAEGSENAENTVNPGGNNTTTESKSPEELDETVEDNSLGGDEIVSDSLSGKDETMGTEQDGDDVSGEVSEMPGEEPEEESGVSGEEESGGAAKEELENPVEGEEGDADAGESDGLAGEEEGKEDKEESDTSVSEESGKEPGTPAGEKEENSAGGEEAKENTDSAAGEKEVQDNHSEISVEDTNKAETDTEKEESPETGSKNDGEDRKEAADTTEEKSSSSSQDTSDSAETSDRGSENTGAESELSKSDNAVDVVESSAVREYGLVTVDGNTTAMAFVMYLSDTGFVPETVTEDIPEEVQKFLKAAAALPATEEVTKENAEEIGRQVNTIIELWEGLIGLEPGYEEREDVLAAMEVVYAVLEKVLEVEKIEDGAVYSEQQLPHEYSDGVKKSAFENAYNLGQSDTCYGTVKLNGKDEYDQGTPNVWATGGWGGAVNVTDYNWIHIYSSNPNVATASYETDGGQLKIIFTPGTSSGTTKISVGVDAQYPHYSLGTWNMELNFDYTVTNGNSSATGTQLGKVTRSVTYDLNTDDAVWGKQPYDKYYGKRESIGVGIINTAKVYQGYYTYIYDFYAQEMLGITVGDYDTSVATVEAYEITNETNEDDVGNTTMMGVGIKVTGLKAGTTEVVVTPRFKIPTTSDGQTTYQIEGTMPITVYIKVEGEKTTNRYSLTYDANGGLFGKSNSASTSITTTHTTADDNSVFTIASVTPVRDDYDFEGRADTKEGKVKYKYNPTEWEKKAGIIDTITLLKTDPEKTIYAVWKDAPASTTQDLKITKTANLSKVEVGQEVKFTIEIENPNGKPVTVNVEDKLPEGLDFSRVSQSDGGIYDENAHSVTWDDVTIPAYGSKQLLVWVKAKEAGTHTNKATVVWEGGRKDAYASIEVESTSKPQEPKLNVEKSNTGFKVNSQTGNATVDYTVNITNKSGFSIYGLRLTDTLDQPTVTEIDKTNTGKGEVKFSFSNFKVKEKAESAFVVIDENEIETNKDGLVHVMQLLSRNSEFEDEQTVTLTYTIEIENLNDDVAVKVDLHNTAKGASWSRPSATAQASFSKMSHSTAATIADTEDEPDIFDEDTSDASGGEIGDGDGSTTGGVLPRKYKVTYIWKGIPEGSNVTLPIGSKYPAGATADVDTTYTSDTNITINDKTYTFSGWSTEDATIEGNKFTMPERDVNIHGIWNEDKSDKPETPDPTKTTYDVEWYDADTNELIQGPDTRSGVAGHIVSVTEKDKEVEGYTFVPEHKDNILTDSVAEDGSTVLKLYFTKDKEPGKPDPDPNPGPDPDPNPGPDPTPGPVETKVDYTVEWYDADTNELIQESDTRSGVADHTVSVTERDKQVAGYTFVPGHKGNVLTALAAEDGSTVLKLYFTKDGGEVNPGPDPVPEPEPKDVAYTIIHEYYTNGTKDGESTQTLTGKKVGDTIHAADIGTRTSYNGNSYRYTSTDPTHLVLTEESDSNVLILRYDRTVGGNSGSSGGGGGGGGSTATNQTGRVHGTTPNPELAVTVPGDGIPLAEIPEGTDIPDEDVPLAGIPVVDIPDADVPLAGIPDFINILDDDVPLASVPKTSDSSGLWNMMALLSAFGLMAMTMMDRKKRQEKE